MENKSLRFEVRLDPDTRRRLDYIAERMGTPRGAAVRELIRAAADEFAKQELKRRREWAPRLN